MKIRIIAGHCIGNGRDVYPGDVLEVEQGFGERKIKNGWAVAAGADEKVTFWVNPPPLDIPVSAGAPDAPSASSELPAGAPAAPAPATEGARSKRAEKS